jgi:hypothetical protein
MLRSHGDRSVPDVPIVPVVPSLTAVQSSKVQRPMTTPRSRFSASRRAASACAGWMFSSPLMTDKNSSICYLNRLRNSAGFPSIVSDEQSCSLCGGAPSGEIARAHVPEKSIAIFREGRRGPPLQERFHSYPMDERKGLGSLMKSSRQVLCFLRLLSSVRSD